MRLLLSIWFLMLCLIGYSQNISVSATLDTTRGLLGDQFKLRLRVEKPHSSWKVVFPVITDSLSKEIEVVNVKPIDTVVSPNNEILSQELLITVFDTGFFEIPAMPFTISNSSVTDTIRTLPVYFEIMSMKADSTIRDIKAIYKAPLTFREIVPYVLGAVFLLLIGWLLGRYYRKLRLRTTGKEEEMITELPHVIALRELARLREEKPWLNNKVKYYYIRVSDILRTYIERRYNTLAMEQTTGEIMQSLKNKKIDSAELSRLSDVLKLADLVKFAKVIPDPEQNALQVAQAEEFVRNTILQVQESMEGEEIVESSIN